MLSMNMAVQWVLVFTLCASLIIVYALSNARLVAAEDNEEDNGVINIDCGANEDYTDTITNTHYQADSKFVQSGQNYNVSPAYIYDLVIPNKDQLNTLRSFPNGTRNCYTLKPKQVINKRYLIRAYFAYGNYDNKNEVPVFDLYHGVNFWHTVNLSNRADYVVRTEVIYNTSMASIDVCLINTNRGVPFISLLELWPVGDSIYQSASTSPPLIKLLERPFLGLSQNDSSFIRYTDDIYGRSWGKLKRANFDPWIIKATAAIDVNGVVDDYKLPREVLSAAVQASNTSYSLDIFRKYETFYEYYVYLHFFDFEERAETTRRKIEISFNSDDAFTQSRILHYRKALTVFQLIKQGEGIQKISIKSTSDSDLPAMLNALEIYMALSQTNSATQQKDVDAIREIKNVYQIPIINWQGDPCGPTNFIWEDITCSRDNNPGIVSLNLSSSNLAGSIDASFSNLTNLEVLDLSNNELTGEVPAFFAELTKLKILNLTGNKLIGPIPEALTVKSKNNSLQLSLDGNPGLCQMGSCKSTNNVVRLATSIAAASIAVIIIVVIVSMMVNRCKRKNGTVVESSYDKNGGPLKLKNQAFRYSEVLNITDNHKTIIGEGGFGKVYLGTLQDHTQVAVKLLSQSSSQGYKEFQSEAQLLTKIHHRNLVSLIGYCDEGQIKGLIYEYMPNGNLQRHLSERNPNILKWHERLNIAVDTAYGLDYLHNGCKPPIIHRDLKTSNILLDVNMKAKIADFGLSRICVSDFDSHISTTTPAYTPGYVDSRFGNINKRSDVYGFGITLFELITGQPAIIRRAPEDYTHILDWVIPIIESGDIQNIVDPRLQGEFNVNSAWKSVEIALSCTSQSTAQRPDISHILAELKECLTSEMVQRNVERSSTLEVTSLLLESEIGPSVR